MTTKIEELTGEIVTINAQDDLSINSNFQKFLDVIPEITKHAREVLESTNDALDEKQIKETNKELKPVKNAQTVITKAKTYIRNTFNQNRDQMLAEFDKILADNGVDDLIDMVNQVKQREKDIINQRKQNRWDELQTLFEHELINYPDLADLSFTWFKDRHPKLVSGAATRNLKDTDRMQVTNDLNALNNAVMQFKLFKAQGVVDDEASADFIEKFKVSLQNEDGGLNVFNQLLSAAIQATNQRRNATLEAADTPSTTAVTKQDDHIEDDITEHEQTEHIEDSPMIDNADAPMKMPSELPIDDDEMPPYDEPTEMPIDDPTFTISANVAMLIQQAGAKDSAFAGISSDDPQIKKQQTLALIKAVTQAFSEPDNHNNLVEYIRNQISMDESFEMIHALTNRVLD